jgi:hypothetical protein
VTRPEDALEAARREAARMRAAGAYAEAQPREPTPPQPTPAQLHAWALIDPDVSRHRSRRPLAPAIEGVKRLLLRLLGPYHFELIAEQTRFNVALLAYVRRLEERLAELESMLREPRP